MFSTRLHSYLLWRASVDPGEKRLVSARFTTAASLIPALMVGLFCFGWYAGLVVLSALAGAFAAEKLGQRFNNRWIFYNPAGAEDGAWLLSGLLIGLLMPPNVPWFVPLAGGAVAILIAKHWWSADGMPWLQPAAFALLVLHLAFSWWLHPTDRWPVLTRPINAPAAEAEPAGIGSAIGGFFGGDIRASMDRADYRRALFESRDGSKPLTPDGVEAQAVHGARPIDVIQKHGDKTNIDTLEGVEAYDWLHVFLGGTPSCIGGSSALALGLGILLLLFTGAATWIVPFFALTTLGLGLYILGSENIAIHLLTGYTLLGVFYLAADPGTVARSVKGKMLAGVALGLVELLLRKATPLSEGMFISAPLIQMLSFPIDQYICPPKEEARPGGPEDLIRLSGLQRQP